MFSVVMPIFNKREHVAAAIESVLDQRWTDFELILVDDGSTDGSHDVAAAISDPRIQLVSQANGGVASARNHGIRLAQRDWVAFIDADDLWFGTHLDELRRVIETFPDCAVVGTNYLSGATPCVEPPRKKGRLRKIDYFLEASRRIGILSSSTTAVRREAIGAIGGFPPVASGEDLACWAALALRFPVGYSERVTAFYRLGTGGIMDQSAARADPPGLPRSLADVSPSVRLLLDRRSEIDLAQQNSVKRYIASRVESAVRAEYALGAFARGKRWARLGRDYRRYFSRPVRLYLLLPDRLLRRAWLVRRAVRSSSRRRPR